MCSRLVTSMHSVLMCIVSDVAGKLYDGTMRVGFVVLHKRDLLLARG